jgi:hypothetical protein
MTNTLEIHDSQAGRLFRRLEAFLGNEAIDERISQIQRELQIEKGIYREYWVLPNRSWWLGFQEARDFLRSGKSFRGNLTDRMFRPCRTAVEINLLFSSMREDKRNELRARILHADNLNPILFEISTAVHFKLDGYSIDWSDTRSPSATTAPEFIARSSDREIEVECKTKGADAGRRVERPRFYRLSDSIIGKLRKSNLIGKISITTAGRLPSSDNWKSQMLESLPFHKTDTPVSYSLPDGTRIEVQLTKSDGKLHETKTIMDEAHRDRGPYTHVAVTGEQVSNRVADPIIVRLESASLDQFLNAVLDDLKQANRQFSGQRTSIILCYLPEVASFEGLGENSSLRNMTALFFQENCRDCVSSILYSSDAIVEVSGLVISESSPAIRFDNPTYNSSLGPVIRILN